MNKRLQIVTIILATIICVVFMLFSDGIQFNKYMIIDTIGLINNKHSNKSDSKDVNSQGTEITNTEKNNDYRAVLNQFSVTDEYKKYKMEALGEEINQDKVNFFEDNVSYKPSNKDKKKEVSVSNISNGESGLTPSDKSKLLSISSKLSAVDHEKVKVYLESGSSDDIKSVLMLLKKRLSDKEYNTVKELEKNFIYSGDVEQ